MFVHLHPQKMIHTCLFNDCLPSLCLTAAAVTYKFTIYSMLCFGSTFELKLVAVRSTHYAVHCPKTFIMVMSEKMRRIAAHNTILGLL